MRNHPTRIAEVLPPKDGVLLIFNKHDANIVRNWPNATLNKDHGKN